MVEPHRILRGVNSGGGGPGEPTGFPETDHPARNLRGSSSVVPGCGTDTDVCGTWTGATVGGYLRGSGTPGSIVIPGVPEVDAGVRTGRRFPGKRWVNARKPRLSDETGPAKGKWGPGHESRTGYALAVSRTYIRRAIQMAGISATRRIAAAKTGISGVGPDGGFVNTALTPPSMLNTA